MVYEQLSNLIVCTVYHETEHFERINGVLITKGDLPLSPREVSEGKSFVAGSFRKPITEGARLLCGLLLLH